MSMPKILKFVDLFAGLGGLRIGLQNAASELGIEAECVFTSEIKPHAIRAYESNFPHEKIHGDITKIHENEIPNFDVLLAGFPCQPFSSAGKGRGFTDTRGTLFFDIERILRAKSPQYFILENVEGLVTHDRIDKNKPIGRTLEVILEHLQALGYEVAWSVFDSSEYGLAQRRKRIYIVGNKKSQVNLTNFQKSKSFLKDVLEKKFEKDLIIDSPITKQLLSHYDLNALAGMQVRDKRGGSNNVHSWDIEIKGSVSSEQKLILEEMLRQRRRKTWAEIKAIPWSDGMPLTAQDILSFTPTWPSLGRKPKLNELTSQLEDLRAKGYLGFEASKKAPESEPGYNIVVGKLSFDISYILDPSSVTPTLVATDVTRLAIGVEPDKFRRLSVREGLRLFGFPDSYEMPKDILYTKAFDLLGNSVTLNVVKMVAKRMLEA